MAKKQFVSYSATYEEDELGIRFLKRVKAHKYEENGTVCGLESYDRDAVLKLGTDGFPLIARIGDGNTLKIS